jgi:TIR domain
MHPRVFLSYIHEGPSEQQRVVDFATRLRSDGVDVILDEFELELKDEWLTWTASQIERSDFVLVVITPTYSEACRDIIAGKVPGRRDNLVEAAILGGSVKHGWDEWVQVRPVDAPFPNPERFIPILFPGTDANLIPAPLRSVEYFDTGDQAGYMRLLEKITGTAIRLDALPAKRRVQFFGQPSNIRFSLPSAASEMIDEIQKQLHAHGIIQLTAGEEDAAVGLAVEYAYWQRASYTGVFLLHADNHPELILSCVTACERMGPSLIYETRDPEARLRRWLEENSGWLLIIDRIEEIDSAQFFLFRKENGKVILIPKRGRPLVAELGLPVLRFNAPQGPQPDSAALAKLGSRGPFPNVLSILPFVGSADIPVEFFFGALKLRAADRRLEPGLGHVPKLDRWFDENLAQHCSEAVDELLDRSLLRPSLIRSSLRALDCSDFLQRTILATMPPDVRTEWAQRVANTMANMISEFRQPRWSVEDSQEHLARSYAHALACARTLDELDLSLPEAAYLYLLLADGIFIFSAVLRGNRGMPILPLPGDRGREDIWQLERRRYFDKAELLYGKAFGPVSPEVAMVLLRMRKNEEGKQIASLCIERFGGPPYDPAPTGGTTRREAELGSETFAGNLLAEAFWRYAKSQEDTNLLRRALRVAKTLGGVPDTELDETRDKLRASDICTLTML